MTTATTTIHAASEAPTHPHVSFQEPESNRPHSSRPRPKHLQPLAIGQLIPRQRRHSGTYIRYPVTGNVLNSVFPHSPLIDEDTPSSATSLATPSLAAVRQYYKDNNLRTAFQGPLSPSAAPPAPKTYTSRRGSVITPSSLAAHFDELAASSPLRSPILLRSPVPGKHQEPAGRTYRQRSIVDESRDMLLDGVPTFEVAQLGSVASSDVSSPAVGPATERRLSYVHFVNSLPNKPPKDRLREFGHLYLGHILTSDVFVRALHIRKEDGRRASLVNNCEDANGEEMNVPKVGEDQEHFMLRARVIPCAKGRKPFLIQRRLNKSDLKAMRAANTVAQKESKFREGEKEGDHRHKLPSRPANLGGSPISPRKMRKEQEQKLTLMPIHMDYALHSFPVLGLLMLSGHIRKGDQVDLPLPHPEAWSEAVIWAYTGQGPAGALSAGATANVLHLGGTVEEMKNEKMKVGGLRELLQGGKGMSDDSDSELSEPPEDI